MISNSWEKWQRKRTNSNSLLEQTYYVIGIDLYLIDIGTNSILNCNITK